MLAIRLPSVSKHGFLRKARRNPHFMIGLGIIVIYVFAAVFGPHLAPHDPYKQDLASKLEGPSLEHAFGNDELGRDILSRIMDGGRYNLGMSVAAASLGLAAGLVLGATSGYFGGRIDAALMTGINVMVAFPDLLIAIAIISVLGSGAFNLVLAIGLAAIPSFARLVRASVLSIRNEQFVDAAVAAGFSTLRIILRHIIPNALAPLLVHVTYTVSAAILIASGLSFLGLGVQPPASEWGVMLSRGRDYFRVAPHIVMIPGIVIAIAVLGLNLFGDGLRDLLDPRQKQT